MNKNWLLKIAATIEAKHGSKTRQRIFGDIQSAPEDSESERKWFCQFINGMDELNDDRFLKTVMADRCPCGHPDFELILRDVYAESKDNKEFADRLAKDNLIEDIVTLEGNKLILTKQPFSKYGKHDHEGPFSKLCHCEIGSYAEKPISDIFCHCCTVGFLGKMFSNALGFEVKVEFVESVITGGKACTAIVYLPEKNKVISKN